MSVRVGKVSFVLFAMLCFAMVCNMLLLQSISRGNFELSVGTGASLANSFTDEKKGGVQDGKNNSGGNIVILNADDKVETTRAIQRELSSLGYKPGPADGTAGLMTQAAIMAFQFDNGLSLSGRADPDLLKILLFGIPEERAVGIKNAKKSVGPDARRVVATVQQTLRQLGYNVGKIDGELGMGTARAIRDFESDQGLRETGRVSGRLVARMVRLADNGRLALSQ